MLLPYQATWETSTKAKHSNIFRLSWLPQYCLGIIIRDIWEPLLKWQTSVRLDIAIIQPFYVFLKAMLKEKMGVMCPLYFNISLRTTLMSLNSDVLRNLNMHYLAKLCPVCSGTLTAFHIYLILPGTLMHCLLMICNWSTRLQSKDVKEVILHNMQKSPDLAFSIYIVYISIYLMGAAVC